MLGSGLGDGLWEWDAARSERGRWKVHKKKWLGGMGGEVDPSDNKTNGCEDCHQGRIKGWMGNWEAHAPAGLRSGLGDGLGEWEAAQESRGWEVPIQPSAPAGATITGMPNRN